MSGQSKRKNIFTRKVFIRKKFQADFSVKFLAIIVVEALLAIGLFIYLSRGTVITGYSGSELVIAKTGEYFLPTLLLTNLILIGLTAAVGFIVFLYASHRIAGPLYRFEASLDEIGSGDLTCRFNLRSTDELNSLAAKLNEFNSRMDTSVSEIKTEAAAVQKALEDLKAAVESADKKRAAELADAAIEKTKRLRRRADYFKTSGKK